MPPKYPYCSLAGRFFHDGISGVCPLNGHPRCRIPALLWDNPSIPTEQGWLRPQRSLVYNFDTLLLHHATSTHPGITFSRAQLASFTKTATRLLALLRDYPWATLTPLDWPDPDTILFSTPNDPLLYDLILLKRQLQQVESISLHTLASSTYIAFRRY